ncbi:MAG: tetratricopeptide repeat protein [Candidatus Margulisbacteria bacterium]|nr:tetratricopeptide repeat protein [Candidatus Margulisiibacteriota bacterium]
MKKIIISGFIMLAVVSLAWCEVDKEVDKEEVSLKAGPTQPGEGLQMAWLEAFVVPKAAAVGEKINLGVRLTSMASSVTVSFDFKQDKIKLFSEDKIAWEGEYRIPQLVAPGMHLARFVIAGPDGSIQRTVEFNVVSPSEENEELQNNVEGEEDPSSSQIFGWPLTITSTCSAYLADNFTRTLQAGDKVVGVSKTAWYKIYTDKGEEGWIEARAVKEPVDEYYHLGYDAFQKKDFASAVDYYKSTIELSPGFIKGYYWLAKTYLQQGNMEQAYLTLKEASRIDERDLSIKLFASGLAQKYFDLAHQDFGSGQYLSAVANYQKALDLKPGSASTWIELGQCYSKLDFPFEARSAWSEALKVDPSNKTVYALLNIDFNPNAAALLASNSAPALAEDSLIIVRNATTNKGTKIESALRSVITLTKSLGTPVVEKGWNIRNKGDGAVVAFICEQGSGVLESFEWKVDVDSKRISASNENARLLMSRW